MFVYASDDMRTGMVTDRLTRMSLRELVALWIRNTLSEASFGGT